MEVGRETRKKVCGGIAVYQIRTLSPNDVVAEAYKLDKVVGIWVSCFVRNVTAFRLPQAWTFGWTWGSIGLRLLQVARIPGTDLLPIK